MDRYSRAWRDPKSPLTPLTPLTSQIFNFTEMGQTPTPVNSTTNRLTLPHQSHASRSGPRHISRDFIRLRSLISPNAQSTTTARDFDTSTNVSSNRYSSQVQGSTRTGSQLKRQFKSCSPISAPPLSPRVRSLLDRTGNQHLTDLFTRQEIDIQVLIKMTLEDLESLGVRGAKELKLAIDVIKLAKKFF